MHFQSDDAAVDVFYDRLSEKVANYRPAYLQRLHIEGATEDEIEQFRVDQGIGALPTYYVAFLRRMGHSAGVLLRGTEAFLPDALGIGQAARELLEAEGVSDLMPSDAVVFALHQGYSVYWMTPTDEPNPPTFLYVEGDKDCRLRWPSFTDFLKYRCKTELHQNFDDR